MTGSSAGAPGLVGIDVAVLAGGLGTRIRSVLGDVPKVLAPVGGRPFLDHLLDWLKGHGAGRVVLCLGVGAARVTDHLAARPPSCIEVVPVIEPEPLGTAGALRFARPHLHSDPVFVLNGDTFLDADLSGFAERHRISGAGLSLLCAEVPSVARYGSVEIGADGLVRRFVEKDEAADRPGAVSAGMYLMSASMLDRLRAMPGPSLERDFLQALPAGTIRAEAVRGAFIDIGTPPSLAEAAHVIPPLSGGRANGRVEGQGAS
jgi:NDP-sugar pyrophosphorylase family protein